MRYDNEKLFVKFNVKTILDCVCGTGQHLHMLSEMGFEVSGSDYSESMLEVADKNLKTYGKTIPLCHCDFRYLEQKYTQAFDAIVCLTTSLPHLHSDNRNESNQYDIIYKIILDDDYRVLLSKAGFKNIQIYGGYDTSDYNEKSQRLIVVAQ